MNITKLKQLVSMHRLPFAISGVVTIALAMTFMSMSLYNTSGTASLDLSRPGFKQVQDQVIDSPTETFDGKGQISNDVMAQFKKMFESERKAVDSFGNFSDISLDDESLQLNEQ